MPLLSDFLSKTPANDDSDWLCQFKRVSESLSSIDEDKELLSFNMFCVAADLFDFVHALKDKIVDFDCEMGETGVQVQFQCYCPHLTLLVSLTRFILTAK